MDEFDGAIISIGLLTDMVFHKFNLSDIFIPHLCVVFEGPVT